MSAVRKFRLTVYASFKYLFFNSFILWGVCLCKCGVGHELWTWKSGTTCRSQLALLPCGHRAQTQAITLKPTEQSHCLMVPSSPKSISFFNGLWQACDDLLRGRESTFSVSSSDKCSLSLLPEQKGQWVLTFVQLPFDGCQNSNWPELWSCFAYHRAGELSMLVPSHCPRTWEVGEGGSEVPWL